MTWVGNVLTRAAGLGIIFFLLTQAAMVWGANWTNNVLLPDGYSEQSLAYYNGFLYQVGGINTANGWPGGLNVFYAQVQTNGTVGSWKATASLPANPFFEHAGIAANGYLYVLGGFLTADMVYYAKINSDGSVGSWLKANSLPYVAYDLSASVWNNTIYVVGGQNFSGLNSNVCSATIQADGSLSAWVTQPSLPTAIYAQAEAANGFLYVFGGGVGDGSVIVNTVYFTKINADGTLAGWNQTSSLPQPVCYFGAVAAGGRIFTMGGYNYIKSSETSSVTNAFYSAPVMGDGTLGAWSAGTSLPQPLYSFGCAASGSNIFVVGGQDSGGNNVNSVYSMALPSAPATSALTKPNIVNNTFNLRLTSTQTNTGFGLLASTNLVNWTNIGWGFTGTTGMLLLQDTNAANFPRRFYRAYWPLP